MRALQSALEYAWRANTIYDVHAPRAFSFLGEVIEDDRHFYAFDRIERERRRLVSDGTPLTVVDHGAGPQRGERARRSVADIARTSGTTPRFGRYLFRTVEWSRARRVLELGTNLGLGAAYLCAPLGEDGLLVSIEGDANLMAEARRTLRHCAVCQPVRLLEGTFAERLPDALDALGTVDVAFLDGHHEEAATKAYFAAVAQRCHGESVVILDDIHWSEGMAAAWTWVKQQPGVTLTIDLYRWGVVFFDPQILRPQHLTIVPSGWKPWHMGFFSSRVPAAQAGGAGTAGSTRSSAAL